MPVEIHHCVRSGNAFNLCEYVLSLWSIWNHIFMSFFLCKINLSLPSDISDIISFMVFKVNRSISLGVYLSFSAVSFTLFLAQVSVALNRMQHIRSHKVKLQKMYLFTLCSPCCTEQMPSLNYHKWWQCLSFTWSQLI